MIFNIISVISLIGVIYLIFFNKKVNQKEEGQVYLTPIPPKLKLSDVDVDYQLVKDVIETAKIESWVAKVQRESFLLSDNSYKLDINNHNNDIKILARVRVVGEKNNTLLTVNTPFITGFHIITSKGTISYDVKLDDKKVDNLITEFIWDFVVKYHERENDE